MLRKRINKYNLPLRDDPSPIERRKEMSEEILKDSTFFPKSVGYKDIDESFKKWVEEEVRIVFEDNVIPVYALFSNQRFTEYKQMWENVDENRNIKMNFMVITRENNPKDSTMYAKAGNIPTNKKYLMKREEILNDQGKKCYLEYRMSQPVAVDFVYRITLVTNKYELLNEGNSLLQNKFSSLQAYLFVNGHPMSMKLNNVSDDSDYTADDRQYFSQTFEILLSGYIIGEDDFEVTISPIVTLNCVGVEGIKNKKKQASVEIEDMDVPVCPQIEENPYYHQPIKLTINFQNCDHNVRSFIIDTDMNVESFKTENIRLCKLSVNDEPVNLNELNGFKENDEIVLSIKPINRSKMSTIEIFGYHPDVIFDRRQDIMESVLDETNISQEIEVQ